MHRALLAAIIALGGLQGLADRAVLAGRVLREGTLSPIESAQISLTRLHPGLPQTDAALDVAQNVAYLLQNPESSSPAYTDGFLFGASQRAGVSAELLKPLSVASAVTDESGSFRFGDLPPGRYALAVRRDGYFTPDGGARNTTMVGRIITIEPGTRPAALDVFMVEGGVISGRVRDPLGRPGNNITVTAYQPGYPDGVISWTSVMGKVTDDRGEYRLYPLRPGQYLVAAVPPPPEVNPESQDSWARTFYPGSDYPLAAVPVTIKDGQEAHAINIDILKIAPIRTYSISGTAINPRPSLGPNPATGTVDRSFANFYLVSRAPSLLDSVSFPTQTPNAIPAGSRPNGEFEIRNVKPGAYDLYAAYLDRTVGRYFISRTPVEVLDKNVTGLSIAISPGGTLETQVVIEGNTAPPIRLDSLQLDFRTIDTTPRMIAGLNSGQAFDAAGKVVLQNFPEARYRFALRGLPTDAYIADIQQSGRSVYDEGVVVGQQLESVRISIRTDSGTVTGSVGRSGKGVTKATVILVPPAARRKNPQLFRTATTGEEGGFTMRGVIPGVYTILALQSHPSGEPWLNEAFLAPFLQRGQEVRIDARSTVPVRLELIAGP
jgi:protocatechuate 3,4-dioxygenase beta subunit